MVALRTRRLAARLNRRAVASFRRWLRVRRLLALAGAATVLVGALLAGSLLWVRNASVSHMFTAESVPQRPVALVFGSQVKNGDQISPVFVSRLDAARDLYQRGKVRAILVSGDNGRVDYNEIDPSRRWLIDRGIPAVKVVGDYAGFDTYSSCVRATRIFGVHEAVLVTQAYHLPRAVALCRRVGIDAVGVPASDAALDAATLRRLSLRDRFACVKATGEMVVQPDPKYLGRHETGVEQALAAP